METKMYAKVITLRTHTDNRINTVNTSKTSLENNVNINKNMDIETQAKEVSL